MTNRGRNEIGNDVYSGFMRRVVRAFGRRIGAGDIAALPELVMLRDELDAAIADAVAQLRAEPNHYSWADIGRALGISRQAAQKRFEGVVEGARKAGGQPSHLR